MHQMNYTLRSKSRTSSHVTKIWKRIAPEPEVGQPYVDSDWASQLEAIEAELEEMQNTGILRPAWAVGLTNAEVLAIAAHEGLNPYRYDWWDGIDPVVLAEARRGGFRRGITHTLTELKAKRAQLRREIAWSR
jgi:hypothetical protein